MSMHEENVKRYNDQRIQTGRIGQIIYVSILVAYGLYCLIGLVNESKKNLPIENNYVSKESK